MLFDWDESSISHIARHNITPQEAEQALRNDPFDLSYEFVDGEHRFGQLGETDAFRIVFIASTVRGDRIRVVTCYDASKTRVKLFLQAKGRRP